MLRGKLDFSRYVEKPWRECCCISEVSVLELRYGAENSSNPSKHHTAVDRFLSGLNVFPIISSVDIYAREKVRLRKAGIVLHDEILSIGLIFPAERTTQFGLLRMLR
jgi:tRNA(fMet)-specific endonuclease VapC